MILKAELYRVVVQKDAIEETSKGGIVLQATNERKRQESSAHQIVTILDIGRTAFVNERGERTSDLKVGDRVMIAKFAGAFKDEDPTKPAVGVVNDEDIICKVIEEDNDE